MRLTGTIFHLFVEVKPELANPGVGGIEEVFRSHHRACVAGAFRICFDLVV
jgi:hypothetical protein